ncbi:MAG: hypothetical protein LAN70_15675 [Acidobacteriia bacterium]|nr:hypothetical protein [Terriglobia bacterium]
MDLQVISTQHKFYRVDVDALCHILLELFPENLKRINPAPVNLAGLHGNVQVPRPAVASEWGLAKSYGDINKVVGLQITLAGGEVLAVGGPADKIVENCKRSLAGRPASLPSDLLIRLYAEATGQMDSDVIREREHQQRMALQTKLEQQNARTTPDAIAQVVAEGHK